MPYNVISTTYIAKFKINSNTKIEVFYKDKNLVSVSKVYKVQYNSNGIIRQLIGNDINLKYKCNSIYYYYSDDSILDIDSFDVLKDGIIVDINNDYDKDEDDEDEDDEDDDKDDEDDEDHDEDNEEIKPKRVTGFILFCNSIRDDVMTNWQQFVEEGGTKSPTKKIKYIMAASSQMWYALGEDGRTVWNDKAKTKSNPPPSHNRNHDNDDEDDKLINMPSSFVICKENLKTPFQDCVKKWESLSYKKRVEFYTTYKAELNIKA